MTSLTTRNREKRLVDFIVQAINASNNQLAMSLIKLTESELDMIANALSKKPLSVLIQELIDYTLPAEALPLAISRRPFSGLEASTIKTLIELVFEHPDKSGDLSNIIKSHFGLRTSRPSSFVTLEAHANVTEADGSLLNQLVCLGFEPDNFHKLEPSCYKSNLTLSFVTKKAHVSRQRYLQKLLLERAQAASRLIQDDASVSGFIESEFYDSRRLVRYKKFRAVTKDGLAQFPFGPGSFKVISLPNTQSDATHRGIRLNSHKRIDVHVKMPTAILEDRFKGAGSPEMAELRERLLASGFYEIVSESGNAIFTAQFLKASQGLDMFCELEKFGRKYNCFIDLCAEICTDFWRKRLKTPNGYEMAVVSPVLSPV